MEQEKELQKPQQQPSDWSIGELYTSAVNLVKKNKVLWIFAIALGSTGSVSFRQSSNLSQKDIQNIQNVFHTSHQTSHNVLGAATDAASETMGYLFSAIHPAWYFLIGMEFLFIIVVGTVISLIYRSWAEASLLQSVDNAMHERPVSIKDASEKAFSSIKSLIWVHYIPTLIILGAFIVALLVTFLIGTFAGVAFMITFFILEFILFLGCMIVYCFALIWAVRKIVLDNEPRYQALLSGITITKKKFWPVVGLGLLNVIIEGILVVILLVPLFVVFFGGIGLFIVAMAFKIPVAMGLIFLIGLILVIAAGTFFEVGSGILSAFTTTVWSLAYDRIRGKYDK